MRTLKVKTLTRTVVDFFNGLLDLSVGHLCKIASLGKVLAKQSIGVLVQPTLPGVVWIGKVDINAQRGCNLDVTGKLLTIVKSDCVQAIRISAEQSVNGCRLFQELLWQMSFLARRRRDFLSAKVTIAPL